jgi:hypothetical protein
LRGWASCKDSFLMFSANQQKGISIDPQWFFFFLLKTVLKYIARNSDDIFPLYSPKVQLRGKSAWLSWLKMWFPCIHWLFFALRRKQATPPPGLMASGKMACDGLSPVQPHSKQCKIYMNILPHDLNQLIRQHEEISLLVAQTHYFWSQAVPRPIWWHQAEWLAPAILVAMKSTTSQTVLALK